MREEWQLYFDGITNRMNGVVDEFGSLPPPAPTGAEYVVSSSNGTLTAERVATDTTTVDYDAGTAGQAKWNVKEVPGIAATGMVARTAAATYTARALTAPASGITVSNGDGVAGNPTLALANDIAALEGLGSTGFAARTGTDAWAQRTLQAGAGISIDNPAGVAGDPSIACTVTQSLGRRNIADISGGDTVIGTDNAKILNIASGTGTLAFTAVATLASGFYCIIKNSGTGNVTLNPDGAELIDGLATWILYPGGSILVQCDGSTLRSVLLSPMTVTFDVSGTFTTPGVGTWVDIEGWGAGASGGRGATSVAGGGGGGGGYNRRMLLRTLLAATETVTIGAGGAARTTNVAGADGGNSTFGSLLTAYGGGAGQVGANGRGGAGGGAISAASGATAGAPAGDDLLNNSGWGGSATANTAGVAGKDSGYGGASGGSGDSATGGAGGSSLYGGAGGGGGGDTTAGGAGGTSQYGGNGGDGATAAANAADGVQPAGGGGGSETGNSGAGADGRITARIF